MVQTLVIFDTSALPEYYDDVHKILALPNKHIVTYDYGEGNVSTAAIDVLRKKKLRRKTKFEPYSRTFSLGPTRRAQA